MGGLTLRLAQQFVSSPSVKYWLVSKLHPSTASFFVDFTVDSNSTSRTGRMHQYYLTSCGAGKSFYICSNGSSDK